MSMRALLLRISKHTRMEGQQGSLLSRDVAAAHRLEIGICAVERDDGEKILSVRQLHCLCCVFLYLFDVISAVPSRRISLCMR